MQAVNVRFLNNLRTPCTKQHHSIETNWNVKRNFYCNTPGTEIKTPRLTSSFFRSGFLCPKRHFGVLPLNDLCTAGSSRWALAQHSTTKCSRTQRCQRKGTEGWGVLLVFLNPSYTLLRLWGVRLHGNVPDAVSLTTECLKFPGSQLGVL